MRPSELQPAPIHTTPVQPSPLPPSPTQAPPSAPPLEPQYEQEPVPRGCSTEGDAGLGAGTVSPMRRMRLEEGEPGEAEGATPPEAAARVLILSKVV